MSIFISFCVWAVATFLTLMVSAIMSILLHRGEGESEAEKLQSQVSIAYGITGMICGFLILDILILKGML